MLKIRMNKARRILVPVFILLVALSTLFASLAFFTDRANKTTTIQISTFNDDGYSIEQLAPNGWFVAGETVEVQIKESNDKEENITSQITMTVVWDSPVPDVYPWGNTTDTGNAVIQIDDEAIPYTTDGNTITFTLPEKLLTAKTTNETLLKFQIPSDLASTGRLYFSYEEIELSQHPHGWTTDYASTDLSDLSFDVGVVWNISAKQSTKDVIAYLTTGSTANDTNYGLSIVKAGSDANTNKGIMMDWSRAGETPWSNYTVTELSIGEKVTTIGDYAFAGETGITSVNIPSTITDIGVSAFDGAGLSGTLTIPAAVESIECLAFGNLPLVTTIEFGHSNTDDLTLPDNESATTSGAFYVGSPYTPTSPLGTTILTDNNDILNYAWNMDARGYTVTVKSVTGIVLAATPTTSIPYKTITLSPTAQAGYEYAGSVLTWGSTNKNLAADATTFTMPAANVTVTPKVSLISYSIFYELNGGDLGDDAPINYNVTSDTIPLPDPSRPGYTFDGWYEDSTFSGNPVTQIATGSTGDKTFYAKWTANTDTPYTVHHWLQNLDGAAEQDETNYTLTDTDYLTGTTDSKVTPARNTYVGFTAPSGVEITIGGDGNTELDYYYTRNSYAFTLGSCNGVTTSGSTNTGTYRYGTPITLSASISAGYTWNSWISNSSLVANKTSTKASFTMPAGDLTMTPNATLDTYYITYELNGGTLSADAPTSYHITSATFSLPTPTKVGYTFSDWYTSADFSGSTATQIVKGSTGNKTFYAKWIPNSDTKYTVNHWQQTLTGGDAQNSTNYELVDTEKKAGTTGSNVKPGVKTYLGFTSPSTQTVIIAADGSAVVNYYYTRNSYTFTLGSCNGVSTSGSTASGTYKYGFSITLEASISDGYLWNYWESSNTDLLGNLSAASTEFNMPAGDITMTPNASLDSYTITYYLKGGTQGANPVTSYTVESATFALPTPTRTGYVFAGWFEDINLTGTAVTQITKGSTGDKAFYAKWTANTNTAYTVKHWQQTLTGGSTQNSTNYAIEETETLTGTTGAKVTPAVKKYTGFTSPATQTVTIAADGSTVVNYYYTRNSYTYTLGSHDGVSTSGSTASGTYRYGYTITLKATANSGYTWNTWTSSNTSLVASTTTANTTVTMPARNLTMTPSATLNTYTIHYELNGGTQASNPPTSYNVTTATFSLPTPTKTGYTFDGWYEDSGLTGTAVTQITNGTTGDKTFYAKWTPNTDTTYTVQHWQQTLTGGSAQNSTNYVVKNTENLTGTTGAKVTPAVKSYTGFTSPSTQTVTIAADGSTVVNYYYTRNSYQFTLGTHSGVTTTGSTATGTYKYGATITLKATAKTGYTWTKWTSSTTAVSSTTTANTTFVMPACAVTMTPSATAIEYTISYELNGGTQASNPPTSYTIESSTITLPTPTKTGYAFAGWYENSGLTGTAVTQIATGTTGNKTFYAKWTQMAPVLAKQNTWYTQGGTSIAKSKIVTITFVDTVDSDTVSNAGTNFWDASDGKVGTVYAYLVETGSSTGLYNLTIAGNGYGKIYANADSKYAFGYFTGLKTISGLTTGEGTAFLDTSNTTLMSFMFAGDTSLTTADVSQFDTSHVTSFGSMFYNCSALTTVPVDNFVTSSATDFSQMFAYCSKLQSVNVNTSTDQTKWNMSNAKQLEHMFNNCKVLTSLDLSGWDVGSVKAANAMFQNCYALTTIGDTSGWTFSTNLTDTSYMFNGCKVLTGVDVSNWIVSKVTTMAAMFTNCAKLTELAVDQWTVSSAKDMSSMFKGCTTLVTLNTANWSTTSVTNTSYMFANCSKLPALVVTDWDMSNVSNMSAMFYKCYRLATLDVSDWDTSSVTSVTGSEGSGGYYTDQGLFEYCSDLSSIDISTWDMSGVSNTAHMFRYCTSLESLTIPSSLLIISPEFAYACTSLTEITFLHSSSAAISLPSESGVESAESFTTAQGENGEYSDGGAFYATSSYSLTSPLRTKITTSNATVLAYDWTTDRRGYTIAVSTATGGTLTVNTSISINGKTITLTATTDDGYTYGGATINYTLNGVAKTSTLSASTTTFTMPAADVTINPVWKLPEPILAATDSWYTGSTDKSTITEVIIMDTYNATGSEVEFWDASAAANGSVMAYILLNDDSTTHTLILAGNGSGMVYANKDSSKAFRYFNAMTDFTNADIFNTSKVYYAGEIYSYKGMFSFCQSLKNIDVSNWDTSNMRRTNSMFYACNALSTLDVSDWDMSRVTDAGYMFCDCDTLVSLPVGNWNIGNLKEMNGMFEDCPLLADLDVSNWDVGSATIMNYLFAGCSSLTTLDVSNWNVENVTEMSGLFDGCKLLSSLDVSKWNVSKVTTFQAMFYFCKSLGTLDVATKTIGTGDNAYIAWDTGSATNMRNMFCYCNTINGLDVSGWDVSLVENMRSMFAGCFALTTLDVSKWATDSVTTLTSMFSQCYVLADPPVSNFNTANVTAMNAMFYQCYSIKNLNLSSWNTANVLTLGEEGTNNGIFNQCTSLQNLNVAGWDTSNVTDMTAAFQNCTSLSNLDLTGWSTSSVTEREGMFSGMTLLSTITLDANFTFSSISGLLPKPDDTHITGADGKWYNTTTGVGYSPTELAAVHGGTTVTYSAIPSTSA